MEEQKMTKLRAQKVAILGQHLTELMLAAVVAGNCDCPEHQSGAVDDGALQWTDAVYAVGMAAKALTVAAHAISEKHGTPINIEELTAQFREVFVNALDDDRLRIIRFTSREEMEAFMQQAQHGGH